MWGSPKMQVPRGSNHGPSSRGSHSPPLGCKIFFALTHFTVYNSASNVFSSQRFLRHLCDTRILKPRSSSCRKDWDTRACRVCSFTGPQDIATKSNQIPEALWHAMRYANTKMKICDVSQSWDTYTCHVCSSTGSLESDARSLNRLNSILIVVSLR